MEGFSSAELLFFQGREEALPLYGAVLERIYEACPEDADGALTGWLQRAVAFAAGKRKQP